MLKDLGVDVSKNTKIDKAVLEVRVDASAGRGMAVLESQEDSSHCYSKLAGTKTHARRHCQNHENPWNLGPDRSWNQTP